VSTTVRTPLRATALSLAVVLCTLLTPPAARAQGQGFQPPEYYGESGLDIGWDQMLWHPECEMAMPVTGDFRADCIASAQDEDAVRQQLSAQDRGLRAGVLMLAQVWAAVETMKELVSTGHDMYAQYVSLVHHFDQHKPSLAVIRIADATDDLTSHMETLSNPQLAGALPMEDQRFGVVNALAIRALGIARDGEVANNSYNDALTGVTYRLGKDGRVALLAFNGDSAGIGTGLPPLPVDAPPDAFTNYGNELQVYAAAGQLGPANGRSAAFGPQFAGELAAQTSGQTQCVVPEDTDNMDPAVMFTRVATMIHGARTAIQVPMADVAVAREEVRALAEREKENVYEAKFRALLKMFHSF
jgi:hypothetical protein